MVWFPSLHKITASPSANNQAGGCGFKSIVPSNPTKYILTDTAFWFHLLAMFLSISSTRRVTIPNEWLISSNCICSRHSIRSAACNMHLVMNAYLEKCLVVNVHVNARIKPSWVFDPSITIWRWKSFCSACNLVPNLWVIITRSYIDLLTEL